MKLNGVRRCPSAVFLKSISVAIAALANFRSSRAKRLLQIENGVTHTPIKLRFWAKLVNGLSALASAREGP